MYLWTWARGRKAVRQPLVRSFSLQSSKFLKDRSHPTRHERCWVRTYSLCSPTLQMIGPLSLCLWVQEGCTVEGPLCRCLHIDGEKVSPRFLSLFPSCPYKCLPWSLALSWEKQTPSLWGAVDWRLALGQSKEPNHLWGQDKDIWITPACPVVYPAAQGGILLESSNRWANTDVKHIFCPSKLSLNVIVSSGEIWTFCIWKCSPKLWIACSAAVSDG